MRFILSAFLALALISCSGGGGSVDPAKKPDWGDKPGWGKGGKDKGGDPAPDPAPDPTQPRPDPLGPSVACDSECKWNLDLVNAEAAYLRGATGAGVNVAVIDTGVDPDHPDLDDNISPDSADVVSGGTFQDIGGHGTKVSGVIAAERNGLGMQGVAFDATILGIQAATCDSGCIFYFSHIARALDYAVSHGAHVANLSLGGSGSSGTLNSAIQRAAESGMFVVIASGNSGASEPAYPANQAAVNPNMVIAVGAVDGSGNITSWSNRCGSVESCLVAPGSSIPTTRNGGSWGSASGTSFSAPHVAGGLALLIQMYPDAYFADPRTISQFMFDGARDLGPAGWDSTYGYGLLDIEGAINVADAAIAAATLDGYLLSNTRLTLGPAFGDALQTLEATATINLSDGPHPYRARLGAVSSSTSVFTLTAPTTPVRVSEGFTLGLDSPIGKLVQDETVVSLDREGWRFSFMDGEDVRLGQIGKGWFDFGVLLEDESLLGSRGEGALGLSRTSTIYGTVNHSIGWLDMSATLTQSNIRGWSPVYASAFDLSTEFGNLDISLSQPLRVESASFRGFDATPSGREIDLLLDYQATENLSTWLLLQREPGHNANADPAAAVGFRYTLNF